MLHSLVMREGLCCVNGSLVVGETEANLVLVNSKRSASALSCAKVSSSCRRRRIVCGVGGLSMLNALILGIGKDKRLDGFHVVDEVVSECLL